MLDSALLTVFDDSISTSLSDIAMIAPVITIDLFHFGLKSFATTLDSLIGFKFGLINFLLLSIDVIVFVQTLFQCGFYLTLDLIVVLDHILGLLDDSHRIKCFL